LTPADIESNPTVAAAAQLLQALLRANLSKIHDFFSREDLPAFLAKATQEAKEVLANIETQIEQGAESYPVWWEGWKSEAHGELLDVLFTEEGRHVTSYPIRGDEPDKLRKARSNDLRPSLTAYTAA
jgi:hypothetical protein